MHLYWLHFVRTSLWNSWNHKKSIQNYCTFVFGPTVHEDNTICCHPLVRIFIVSDNDPHISLFQIDNLQEFGFKCVFILLFRFSWFLLLQRLLFTWVFIPEMNVVITFHHWPIWLNLNSSPVWSSLFFFWAISFG